MQALFEIANLSMHVPESFVLSNRRAKDVAQQIKAFDQLAAKELMASGFVTMFLEMIDTDEEVVQLLRSIDVRL